MPTKPTKEVLDKRKKVFNDPEYSKNALRSVINDVPEIKDYLLAKGVVYEVEEN